MTHLRHFFPAWFMVASLTMAACAHTPQAEQDTALPHPEPIRIDTARPAPGVLEQSLIDSGLIDIQSFIPGIHVDLKYSSTDNFVHADVYGALARCYLRPEAAEKLKRAQSMLQSEHPGWSLIVYDGARPNSVQALMWEKLDIPFKRNYLAPPWEGSVHNYGCAVDLSIVDEQGRAIDMGTPFDFFGKEAQPQLEGQMLAQGKLTEGHLENRRLLRRIMKSAGFHEIHTEWWHFNAVSNARVRQLYTRIP